MNRQTNDASAKSKELQSIKQAYTVAAHLILPNRTHTNQHSSFLTNLQTVDKILKNYCDKVKDTYYI
jgi:hypothetical protein